MLTMMDKIQGDDPIESKAIELNPVNDGRRVPVIVTAFEEEDNEPLDNAGYRGRYVLFTLIDGGVQDAFTDPYKATHHVVTGCVRGFCIDLRRGWETHGKEGTDWSEIEHGEVYNIGNAEGEGED